MTIPMRAFHGEVVEAFDLSPAMRRIVLGGPGLADYASTGIGDEYVRILFPEDPDVPPPLPPIVDGHLDWSAIDLDQLRTYTIRDHDQTRGTVTIDFVVHEGGVAAAWALQARAGQVVAINSPTALYGAPGDAEWQLLVADCAALPAALRIAETTTIPTRLVVEVADASHRVEVGQRENLEVTWVTGGNGAAPSRLEAVVRALQRPAGTGYVWVAGESKALRGIRRHLRRDLGLPVTAYKAVGYWIEDAERWRERYDALDDETRASLEALWTSGRDEDEIELEYDTRLTRLGL